MSSLSSRLDFDKDGRKAARVDFGNLVSRLHSQALILFITLGILIFGLSITIMASFTYLRSKDKFWNVIQDNYRNIMYTIVGSAAGIFVAYLIIACVWGFYFNGKLRTEDKFLTEMSVVASAPVSVSNVKTTLADYLNSRLGEGSFGPEDMEKFGNMLASKKEFVHQLDDNALPTYLRNRLGTYGNMYREEYRVGRNDGPYTLGPVEGGDDLVPEDGDRGYDNSQEQPMQGQSVQEQPMQGQSVQEDYRGPKGERARSGSVWSLG